MLMVKSVYDQIDHQKGPFDRINGRKWPWTMLVVKRAFDQINGQNEPLTKRMVLKALVNGQYGLCPNESSKRALACGRQPAPAEPRRAGPVCGGMPSVGAGPINMSIGPKAN